MPVEIFVQEHADANERLARSKVTDNARIILALTAIGKDVTNVGGHNLLKGLDNMAYVQTQGINGPIFTLIALDSHNYPTMGDVTREKLIQVILDAQLNDGGWTLSGTKADPDITDVAIQTGGSNTPATGDTGVLVWIIALPVTILAAAFVLKRKEREA